MYQLANFTQNITPFIEEQSLERFMLELEKVPNCQERFQNLIKADSKWLETALKTKDDKGFHINFFYKEVKVNEKDVKPNQLFLRNFCLNTEPTLMIEVYKH